MEEKTLSVLSSNPAERKLARKIRMQQRNEELKRIETASEKDVEFKTEAEKQIACSANLLNSLLEECNEVTSNVRLANDARELARRKEVQETKRKLTILLEENAMKCAENYKEINEKWESIRSTVDILEINSELEEQNKRCLEVLNMKDEMIAELKQELEKSETKFIADQQKHNEEINLLIDRIDNQVNVMNEAYSEELLKIDEVLESERKNIMESLSKKWEALYEKHKQDSLNGIELRKEIIRECEAEIDRIMVQHYEDYRNEKIKLETECQALQQQLEYTKALCTLNTEKLNYNYIILKRREEENAVIKNYQRKKLNKLQDTINSYKKRIAEIKQTMEIEKQQMSDDIKKYYTKIEELEQKTNHFVAINEKQYFDIWDMNTEMANKLMNEILQVDKQIHEEILGVKWKPPTRAFLKKEDLPSYRQAKEMIENKEEADIREATKQSDSIDTPADLLEISLKRQLLNKLFQILPDKSDIFIEERLQSILKNYSNEKMIVIKLDNVFKALDITSEQDVNLLLKLFLPYTYCSTCDDLTEKTTERSICSLTSSSTSTPECLSHREQKLVDVVKNVLSEIPSTPEKEESTRSDQALTCIFEEEKTDRIDTERSIVKQKLLCEKGHLLDIKTVYVVSVLKEFITKYGPRKTNMSGEQKSMKNTCKIATKLSAEDVTKYWNQYREMFCQKDEDLWDAVLLGLKKYHEILKERHKISSEIEHLKKQNFELNRLLEATSTNKASNKK